MPYIIILFIMYRSRHTQLLYCFEMRNITNYQPLSPPLSPPPPVVAEIPTVNSAFSTHICGLPHTSTHLLCISPLVLGDCILVHSFQSSQCNQHLHTIVIQFTHWTL